MSLTSPVMTDGDGQGERVCVQARKQMVLMMRCLSQGLFLLGRSWFLSCIARERLLTCGAFEGWERAWRA